MVFYKHLRKFRRIVDLMLGRDAYGPSVQNDYKIVHYRHVERYRTERKADVSALFSVHISVRETFLLDKIREVAVIDNDTFRFSGRTRSEEENARRFAVYFGSFFNFFF